MRAAALAALVLAACGADAAPSATPVAVEAVPVPLDRRAPSRMRLGELDFVGGLRLRAPEARGFGGLSGLEVGPDGAILAVTDFGDLLRGRIVFDQGGRPSGLADAVLSPLTDEDGRAFGSKTEGDAEDVTFMPDGGYAVAFERDHRILVYPASGPPRLLAPPPGARLGSNYGIEALAYWRAPDGGERLVVGAEAGDAWSCDLRGGDCVRLLDASRDNPGRDYSLTGLDALPDGRLVALYRAASLFSGLSAVVAVVDPSSDRPSRVLARLSGGVTVGNMEGVSAVSLAGGGVRLFLVSDDNFSGFQRTLLLVFDWRG